MSATSGSADDVRMYDGARTSDELLLAWQDTTRAAELARRLSEVAEAASLAAEQDAADSEEVAVLAESAATAATEAAARARAVADRMQTAAVTARGQGRQDAADAAARAGEEEAAARDRYRDAVPLAPDHAWQMEDKDLSADLPG